MSADNDCGVCGIGQDMDELLECESCGRMACPDCRRRDWGVVICDRC